MYRVLQPFFRQQQEELLQLYELFDNRGKGYIDANSLIENMKLLGYEIDRKTIAGMIEHLDQSGKGNISKESFMKFMTARLDYRDDPEDLKGAFVFYSTPHKQLIHVADLRRVAEELGEDGSICQTMLEETDKNEDEALDYQEFIRVIKKTSY